MYNYESYTIGVICALAVEATAFIAMLDRRHSNLRLPPDDCNNYTFGQIGEHMIVVACLPAGSTGTINAAVAASNMMRSFKLRCGLLVGIGGGVPANETDIRLGDVVISQPDGSHGGVIQWDFGKTEAGGIFRRTGTLNKPPRVLLNAVQQVKIKQGGINLSRHIDNMLSRSPELIENGYSYQGQQNDKLFEAAYNHATGADCKECDRTRLVQRLDRGSNESKIHHGNIASGDQVIKDGRTRDAIAKDQAIICFEMEAAGLMDNFPCLVIRGICDYADSHKNKRWQAYAAATAAAYAKELLLSIPVAKTEDENPTVLVTGRCPGNAVNPDLLTKTGGKTNNWNNYGETKIGAQVNYIHSQNQNITF